jgi:HSP20 family protein
MSALRNLPEKSEGSVNPAQRAPFTSLRREIDRLLEDFDGGLWPRSFRQGWLKPLGRGETVPAVDVVEKDNAFEVTAELPGMEEKDIEVSLSDRGLLIRGEKKAEKEEKKKDYYLSERSYGSFERYFGLPEGVAADKIAASFKNGVLTVTLPKTAEARNGQKKIPVTAA